MSAENDPPRLCSLKFVRGPLTGKTIEIRQPLTRLGRDTSNDIIISDPKVSRTHALIRWDQTAWSIEKLAESNTLIVNAQKVQQAIIKQGSTIRLGDDTAFVFQEVANVQFPDMQAAQPQNVSPLPAAPQPQLAPAQPTPPPQPAIQPVPMLAVPPAYTQPEPQGPMSPEDRTMARGVPMLEVSSNVQRAKQSYVLARPIHDIGRSPSCDILIEDTVVSAMHAQIIREGKDWVFIHPHPSRGQTLNGVLYQGRLIRGHEQFRKPLVHGDILRIGDENGTLVTLVYTDASGASQEVVPTIHPIPLGAPLISIGRAPGNMVLLNHPQVSAHHAHLEQGPGGYRLVDLNSTNHVYVNGQRTVNQLLRTNDEIRIGPFRFTYTGTQLTQYDESSSIRIDALDLKKVGNNNVILLNGISFVIPPRKFVALVGGSGAGKSTLMDALNGLRPAQQGMVLYNGQDYYHNLAAFSTQLGYVPQDDIVHRELTVERALFYAAKMRLPSDFTDTQIKQRIDEVLDDVEMSERRSLLVNKLSGGQRKRVSIALELLANPSVFFLDEPTSGLDPGLDRKMMFLLRRLADRGRTIILVTHATNNINACDYVCFLAQGGRMAYFGPPNDAKAFFNKSDFAEIYSTLEPTKDNPHIPQEAEARFKASPDYQRYIHLPVLEGIARRAKSNQAQQNIERVKRGNPLAQFLLLSMRYIELLKNDVGNLLILLLQAPVIALIMVVMVRYEIGADIFNADKIAQCRPQIITSSGPLIIPNVKQSDTVDCEKAVDFLKNDQAGKDYANKKGGVNKALQDFLAPGPGADAQKVLFIMAFATVLFGCINGSREIVKEAAIYRRERAVNLGIIPYMFSKIVVLGMLCLVQSAVLLFIVHIGIPLQGGVFLPVIPEIYGTLVLTSMAGLMLGLTISAIAPNNDRAVSFVPIVLIPQVIFSGVIIPFKHWIMQIIAVIFPTRWAMAALGSSIGLHSDKIGNDKLFGDDYSYHGMLYSTFTQMDAAQRIFVSWFALGMIIIVLTILIGLFLKSKDVRV